MKKTRRTALAAIRPLAAAIGLATAFGATFGTANAAGYPEQPITVVVPYSAGGGADNAARIIAQGMGEVAGQSVVIENKGGASGSIGAAFVARAIDELVPEAARRGLAAAVDGFCEGIGFAPGEIEQLFTAATEHGLRVKLHAEQLSNLGGAALAARYHALSADHLEHLDEAGAQAMAAAGTVGVLLPGAFYALNESRKPPVDLLRAQGVRLAVATDCNPGTSPLLNPQLAMNMACTLFGLSPGEALAGMTVNAAAALGLDVEIGTIEAGKAADLCAWRVDDPAELGYWIGMPGPVRRVVAGRDAPVDPRGYSIA